MKRYFLLAGALALFSLSVDGQGLNVVQRSHLAYPGQTCANICGYVDTVGNEYALLGASQGMSIVDVTDPTTPVEVMQVPNVDDLWKEIKVYGKYAYVTTEGGGGLQIVNMSSLPNVSGVTYHNYTGDGVIAGQLNTIHALHIDGHYCYLYGSNLFSGAAVVLDIADPWNPVYVGKYANTTSAYVHDGYVRNDTLYAGHIYAGFYSVVDFTNKTSPVELANQYTPNNFTHNTWLSTNSKVLFTTDEVSDSYLTAYDISNLANIVELDRIQSNPGSNSIVHNTHILNVAGNDYAVTSWYKDGFTIVDAGRPNNLIQVGNYDNYGPSGDGFEGTWGVYPFLPSGNIVVSNIEDGLYVYTPTYVRACYLEGSVTDSICGVQLNNVHITVTAAGISDSTDIAGDYRTGTPLPGTYNVTYSKSGYITKVISGVVLTPGLVNTQNVQLAPLNTVNLTGTTNDFSTSAALSGAYVLISDPSNTYNFVTDASGNFGTCNVVSANDYDISIAKWGYETVCLSGQTIDSASNAPVFSLTKGYYDDFTFNLGWTAAGTASTGTWERGVPVMTTLGSDTCNAGWDDSTDCHEMAYVTGNGGGSASTDDVDNGYTTLTSPLFDLSTYTTPYLNFSRWFYNGGGTGTPNDSISIYLSNGISTVLVDYATVSSPGISTWVPRSLKVSDFITPTSTMRVVVRAADNAPGHIVEAGFDKFMIHEGPTGINEALAQQNVFTAAPNPFTDAITISYHLESTDHSAKSIEITDVTGRRVALYPLQDNSGSIRFDDQVVPGIYFVKLLGSSQKVQPVKIVKMK